MHLGRKIKEVFDSRNISVVDFARQIGTVRQNVYRIFEREGVDTDLLLRISEALDHDFFQYFRPRVSLPLQFTHGHDKSDTAVEPETVETDTPLEQKPCSQAHTSTVIATANSYLPSELHQRELEMAYKEIEYLKKIIHLLEERTVYIHAAMNGKK